VGELGDLLGAKTEVSKIINLRGIGLDVASGERPLVGIDGETVRGGADNGGVPLVLRVEGTLLAVGLNTLVCMTSKLIKYKQNRNVIETK